jgi:hypothetical protein
VRCEGLSFIAQSFHFYRKDKIKTTQAWNVR